MRNKLYKLAVWYIGKCNAKWEKPKNEVKTLDRLTYWQFDKYMLFYGADAEWQNFSRYDVLDNAIQRLAKYEDEEKEIRNKAIDDLLQKQLEALEDFKYWEDSSGYPIHTMSETQRISKCKELIKKVAQQLKDGGTDG